MDFDVDKTLSELTGTAPPPGVAKRRPRGAVDRLLEQLTTGDEPQAKTQIGRPGDKSFIQDDEDDQPGEFPEDLQEVIKAWPGLSLETRQRIVNLLDQGEGEDDQDDDSDTSESRRLRAARAELKRVREEKAIDDLLVGVIFPVPEGKSVFTKALLPLSQHERNLLIEIIPEREEE